MKISQAGSVSRRQRIIFMLAVFGLACASRSVNTSSADRPSRGIQRVMVVCIQGHTPTTNRRIESQVAPRLRRQGLDVLESGAVLPELSGYSAHALKARMWQLHVDGLMAVEYPEQDVGEGLPKGIRFKYYSLKSLPPKLSDRRTTLDAALRELLQGERP